MYSQLRIWRDANQDGISQAGELKTLAELGIASINVQGTASNTSLSNDSVYGSTSKQALADSIVNINAPYSVANYAICAGFAARFKGKSWRCRRQKQHSQRCASRSTAKTSCAIPARLAGHKRLGRHVDIGLGRFSIKRSRPTAWRAYCGTG